MTSKKELRTLLRKKRASLSPALIHTYSHSAIMHLVKSKLFQNNSHFAIYLAADHEMETALLIDACFMQKKHCYLPRLADKQLLFTHYRAGDLLIPNRFNILEPGPTEKTKLASELDIIFMPLVGFDYFGCRLGMGGGFYDQTLASLDKSVTKKPLLMGLAFECQHLDKLPTDPWDIPLDAILTEKGFRFLNPCS